jgi:hypothetical protein
MTHESAKYLWNAGQLRERQSIARWSFGHANELPVAMGLTIPRGWWCGFFLSRRFVFDEEQDGDVDFVAGPMRYSFSDEELADRLRAARSQDPHGFEELRVHWKAGQEGYVVWPPEVGEIVACEIKTSWFDTQWHRTHESSGAGIELLGQMDVSRQRGINKVAFLHIGVTKPTEERVETWEASSRQLNIAMNSFPNAFPNTEIAYGHFRAGMAATYDGLESVAGTHTHIITERHPEQINPITEQRWHKQLQARLAELPKPKYINIFIHECPKCQKWRHGASPDPADQPCICGANPSDQ